MKKLIILGAIATMGLAMTSCDDFLDENRTTLTTITDGKDYWNNPDNCQLQVDRYIDELNAGYSMGQFYFSTRSDDQVGASFVDWLYPTGVPSSNGNWTYSKVRGANTIIAGVRAASGLTPNQAKNFEGIARLIRADAYYKLVRQFGDCVWQNTIMDPASEALYAPRDNRDIVMDSVMRDLDYAIAAIQTQSAKLTWSKDLALAYKAEVALYEGTFCKYRVQAENGYGPNLERANKYLNMAVDAANQLMNRYGFCEGIEGYHSIYNSVWGGGDGVDGKKITDFSKNEEIIFGRRYDAVNLRHSTIARTASSTTTSGMSLDAFNAFLFSDGKPLSQHPEFSYVGENCEFNVGTEEKPQMIKAYSIAKLLENRDLRLTIATDPYIYYKGLEWSRVGTTGLNSSSGFGVAKYDNVSLPVIARGNDNNNYTSAPIYWNSYIMLIYMEAKAELGNITDADLNLTFNKFMTRAGLPTRTVAELNSIGDTANNMGVSSLLWEIRRCRRCELMFDGFRFWDLIRWHQLELLDSEKHPDILRGAYVGNADVKPSDVDADGYIRPYPTFNRKYEYKHYLQPIPTGQNNLYPLDQKLTQNPGW